MTAAVQALLDKTALRHNVALIREYAPKAQIMAVVKSNAYGHGLEALWPVLEECVEAMAVSRIEEALALRHWGYQGKLLVLSGFQDQDDLKAIDDFNLDIVLHHPQQWQLIEKTPLKKALTLWLKLETGMHRLGLSASEFTEIYAKAQKNAGIKKMVLMTHFASSEYADQDSALQQIAQFQAITKDCPEERSLSNSAAILALPSAHQQWLRPGLMLYGGSPFASPRTLPHLKPVMSLTAPIKAIRNLAPGEAVGYNASFVAKEVMRIGIVGIGYGDGYPRSLETGTPVLVNQKRMSLLGRVSMDLIAIDLSQAPEVSIGDRVLLWGQGLPIETIAEYAKRDPREILCGVCTHRVQRLTIGE